MESKYKTPGYAKDPGTLNFYIRGIRILIPKKYEIVRQ